MRLFEIALRPHENTIDKWKLKLATLTRSKIPDKITFDICHIKTSDRIAWSN